MINFNMIFYQIAKVILILHEKFNSTNITKAPLKSDAFYISKNYIFLKTVEVSVNYSIYRYMD